MRRKKRNIGPFIAGYLRTYRRELAWSLVSPALFTLLHFLGGGVLREVYYALLLTAFTLVAALVISFTRYLRRQTQLWDALASPPPSPEALPPAQGALEEGYRQLAAGYLTALNNAVAQADAAEREKTDYYTLWTHQIKTPIAVMDLMAQSSQPLDRELLRQETFKIGQYAEMALSYQRLQSMEKDMDLAEVHLYPLCASVVKQLRPLFLYRRIHLDMTPFEGTALTDAKWLALVVTQVLTNSLKYTGEGGVIRIGQGAPLVLEIADTGVGIRAEDVPRVFERGFTGQMGRENEKSTGIGLYLCREICNRLGHAIRLASEKGRGTVVTIDLRREAIDIFS